MNKKKTFTSNRHKQKTRGKKKMIKTTNENVPYYWSKGQAARNHTGSLSTNGKNLFSYNLMIGDTSPDGEKILFDYTANTHLGFKSQTTSCHVGKARLSADLISDGVTLRRR